MDTRLARATCAAVLLFATGSALAADRNDSKTIATFVKCLNDTKKAKANVADVIEACIPDKCKMTLTMSQQSAQKACTLAGCKLPRVIFECDGPEASLKFRPSLLMCPTDSKFNGEFGVNRIEAGEETKNPKDASETVMRMADINVPPDTDLTRIDPKEVTSKGAGKGTNKNCNMCHSGGALDLTPEGDLLSRLIDPRRFKAKDLSEFILKNDEIAGICTCIKDNKDKIAMEAMNEDIARKLGEGNVVPAPAGVLVANPKPDMDVLVAMCESVAAYGQRKACGKTPGIPGLACSAVQGGGKFLNANAAVSTLRMDLSGDAVIDNPGSVRFVNPRGDLTAYNYQTRALITSVALSSLTGTSSAGNLEAGAALEFSGVGTALVITPFAPKGVPTSITFAATKIGSWISFSLRNSGGAVLAGGAGEPGFPERTSLAFYGDAP